MTLREAYTLAISRLTPLYGPDEARAVVDRLLEERYGIGRLERIVGGGEEAPFVRGGWSGGNRYSMSRGGRSSTAARSR